MTRHRVTAGKAQSSFINFFLYQYKYAQQSQQ